jgi:hypothetical protein
VRTQDKRDRQTLDIMSAVLSAAVLFFVAVVVLVALEHAR